MNKVIWEEKLKCGIRDALQSDRSEGQLIDKRLFLDTLLMKLMGEVISFSTRHKCKQSWKDESLKEEIAHLEQKNDFGSELG